VALVSTNDKQKDALANAKWYASHKEQSAAYRKAYYAANTKRVKDLNAAWSARHPGYFTAVSIARKEAKAGRPRPDKCEVCGESDRFICFEHDHITGEFRGWTCCGCNAVLGYVNDSVKTLRTLANYVERPLTSSVRITCQFTLARLTKLLGCPPARCEVCKKTVKRAHADHDHKTGLFRGWLCSHCNLALGHARDSAKILRKLADYLRKANTKHKRKQRSS
jgi:hypothetical protein